MRSNEIFINATNPSSHVYHSVATFFCHFRRRLVPIARTSIATLYNGKANTSTMEYRLHINENLSIKVRFNQVCINVSKAPTLAALERWKKEKKQNNSNPTSYVL